MPRRVYLTPQTPAPGAPWAPAAPSGSVITVRAPSNVVVRQNPGGPTEIFEPRSNYPPPPPGLGPVLQSGSLQSGTAVSVPGVWQNVPTSPEWGNVNYVMHSSQNPYGQHQGIPPPPNLGDLAMQMQYAQIERDDANREYQVCFHFTNILNKKILTICVLQEAVQAAQYTNQQGQVLQWAPSGHGGHVLQPAQQQVMHIHNPGTGRSGRVVYDPATGAYYWNNS
ncbi:hypothetical protein EDC01DRAFT_665161 [Geopyxis carbonaria]|nr:hypothetical protein EDC01DRAFT_665161 [Geopyxis carbonaria]